jgi:long-chain acyl-CoA synthetase
VKDPPRASFTTLVELVDRFQGDGPAIIQFGPNDAVATVSYDQLGAKVRRLAVGLQAMGIGSGDLVAIWGPNSAQWVTAYFAVVAAGGTVVPLDEQLMPDQLTRALHKLTPSLVFTVKSRLPDLPVACRHSLLDGDPGPVKCSVSQPWRRPDVGADDVAAILLTSGTTGEPKAVALTHGNLCANIDALVRARIIESKSRVLLPLPLHHAYPWMAGLLVVLATGAVTVLPEGLTGPSIMRAANRAQATAMVAVPRLYSALWEGIEARLHAQPGLSRALTKFLLNLVAVVPERFRIIVGRGLFRRVHRELAPSLRLLACGGAKLDPAVANMLGSLGWKVLSGYGLTETSPVLTFNPPSKPKLGSAGVPVPGIEIRIDPYSETPDGEIQARGPSVFGGYWRDQAATRGAFTDDGWFRTGDLGHVDSEGYLYIVGRSKEVIVLADGKNIMPEAVEAVYAASEYLEEVALLERGGQLVTLLVPNEDAIRQRGAVREAALLREEIEDAASTLPSYQRVTAYRIVRQPLPRTHLGKLQRHLLGELFEAAGTFESTAPEAPLRQADETLLREEPAKSLWTWLQLRFSDHALTLDTSPQLDLGVDSLAWVSLTLEIERRFGITLSDEAVSKVLTLRDLLVQACAPEASLSPPGRVVSVGDGDELESIESRGWVARMLGWMVSVAIGPVMRLLFRLSADGTSNLPARGPFIVVPNHASYLDPLAIGAALPRRQLENTYWAGYVGVMYAGPLSRLTSQAMRVFPVNPDRGLNSGIRMAVELLRQGNIVVWFPEGRRSPTGELQPFLAGVGRVLGECAVPVIPAAIKGSFEAWPKHHRLPRRKKISVRFGSPIPLGEEPGEAPLETAERIGSELYREVDGLLKSTQ